MWVYIVRRLAWLPFLLLAVSFITFTLGRFGPGDPVIVILGNRYDPDSQVTKNLRHELGLDRPFHVQYVDYVWHFVQGDFGESLRFRGQPVKGLILQKMWVSAQLAIAAMIVAVSVGLPLGFWIAHRQGRWQDPATVTLALALMSIPIMVSVPGLLWVFCLKLHWVPCSGWGGFFDVRILVPAITMGVPGIAGFVRLMRASTLDVLGQDFIRTAKAKGLNSSTVASRHVARNAMIPIITILSFSLAGLISGSFIVETILGVPGIGRFAVESVFNRDYPVIMAVTLIAASAFVLANLAADIGYAYVDPRIRYN
ncbi:MAG: ABC transporter permease [SAR202 cluster bacterium]|nr:ABC transporter permease [SAR202 cluster bacterium]